MGLGNPGSTYRNTRHNAGFDAVDRIFADHKTHRGGFTRSKGSDAEIAEAEIFQKKILLAKPMAYMNESGPAVKRLVKRYLKKHMGSGFENLIVIHDEMDLPAGKVRVRYGGGNAGHNGLKSISRALGGADYFKVKIGIGKPPSAKAGADFVLSRPEPAEEPLFAAAFEIVSDFMARTAEIGPDSSDLN